MRARRPRVVFDLRACHFHQERGIPNYAINLSSAIASTGFFDCAFLVYRDRPEIELLPRVKDLGAIIFNEELDKHIVPVDIFLMTSVMSGLSFKGQYARHIIPESIADQKPLILSVIYDLIPLLMAGRYLRHPDLISNNNKGIRILRACHHHFAISDATRDDAMKHLNLPAQQITTIPGGIDHEVWKSLSGEIRASYVVYVAGDDPRKNLRGLIVGFRRFRANNPRSELRLSIVCELRLETLKSLQSLAGQDIASINFHGLMAQKDLVRLVCNAKASIFPSLYEGLGLPILESYAVGTPVFGSNNSSVKELVHPECQFDPFSTREISDAFAKIDSNYKIYQKSLSFGRQKLEWHTWRLTGQLTADKMLNLLAVHPLKKASGVGHLALASALSPEDTGVAIFSSQAFQFTKNRIIYFSKNTAGRREAADKISILREFNIPYSLASLSRLRTEAGKEICRAVVVVLGNSKHFVPILREAIKLRSASKPVIVYLHEARMSGLLYEFFRNNEEFMRRMRDAYPEVNIGDNPHNVLGLRVIYELLHCTLFIVNSKRCADLVREELFSVSKLRIETLFLPIFNHTINMNDDSSQGGFRIGHFGGFSKTKSPSVIISAARFIAMKRPTRLLFAGRECRADMHPEFADSSLIDWIENPSDDDLLKLIRSVNVVVQPRPWDHGESSGVINQAISLGKIPITSAGTAADELGPLVRLVDKNASVSGWVEAIEDVYSRESDSRHSFDHLSVEAFGDAFDKAVDGLLSERSGRQMR